MKKQSTLRKALRSVLPMVALAAMNLSAYAINLVPSNTSRTATVGVPVCDTWTSNATGTSSGSATVTVSWTSSAFGSGSTSGVKTVTVSPSCWTPTAADLGHTVSITFTYSASNQAGTSTKTYTYTVGATDAPAPCNLSLNGASVTNVSCNDADNGPKGNGSIDLDVSGASATATYLWSNGATTQNISGLTAGSYSVTINDGDGCSASGTYSITTPAPMADELGLSATIANVSCNSADNGTKNDGAIALNTDDPTSTTSYLWSNGATTQDVSGLTVGDYSVTISNSKGCSISRTYSVSAPAPLGGSFAAEPARITTACPQGYILFGYDVNIQYDANGGTPGYTYNWTAGASGSSNIGTIPTTGTAPTAFTVKVTDAKGCYQSFSRTSCITDVRCGTPGNSTKTTMCRNNKTLCVDNNAVAAQLASGAQIGPCGLPSMRTLESAGFEVFPNPATNSVSVSLSQKADAQISLVDLQGRTVRSTSVAEGSQIVTLDLSGVQAGLYFLNIVNGSESTSVKLTVN